jgi:DNA-directed RNA polymerase subunit RPC12/RpoP
MALGWQIVLMSVSIVVLVGAALLVLWTESRVGFYVCAKCGHRHVPSYGKLLISMHVGYDRYMKCPKCGKLSWNKKLWTEE